MGILATYNLYKHYEGQYKDWNRSQDIAGAKRTFLNAKDINKNNEAELYQKKASIIADSMLVLDDYAQSKAEDVEAVFQTMQIEALAGLSALSALPAAITGVIPKLEKSNSSVLKKGAMLLNKYKNINIKTGSFSMPLPKLLTAGAGILSAFIYVPLVTEFVKNQLGASRRAKFEGMHTELSNINDFAVLTDEQEKEVQQILLSQNKNNKKSLKHISHSAAEIFDGINITKSLFEVKNLLKDKNSYINNKEKYNQDMAENLKHSNQSLSKTQLENAQKDANLFNDIVKNVDLKSQEPLERIEKIINVGYGSLFVGGFLEYLVSDKLISKLNIKNPIINRVLGFGIPLVTYMVLNKNLAKIQNSAIKAVRYNNLQDYISDKNNFKYYSEQEMASVKDENIHQKNKPEKKENIFAFIKNLNGDIKNYHNYKKTKFIQTKEYMNAKRQINLSVSQKQEAGLLQRNTFMTINKVDDNNQKFSESIEALSEIALAPIEIASTAAGAFIGNKIASAIKIPKYKALFTAAGAVIGFIPSALAEICTTGIQRKALKISNMLSMNELKDYKNFIDYSKISQSNQSSQDSIFVFNSPMPQAFMSFKQTFKENA